jgi:deoxyuridine 5'-triphosphate nucleotidohydrolase
LETKLYIAKEFPDAIVPTRNHSTDAGFDIYCYEGITVPANGYARVKTGIRITCTEGFWWTPKARSSLGYIKQIEAYSGVMDAGFTNDTTILVYNNSNKDYTINKGDKFCQVVIIPLPKVEIEEVESVEVLEQMFSESRGSKCWGSSGK